MRDSAESVLNSIELFWSSFAWKSGGVDLNSRCGYDFFETFSYQQVCQVVGNTNIYKHVWVVYDTDDF